jgi:hypothetical protein
MQENFIGRKEEFEKALSQLREIYTNKEFPVEIRFGLYDAFLMLNAATARIYCPTYTEKEFFADLKLHSINIFNEFVVYGSD